jgi:hypothetical protein
VKRTAAILLLVILSFNWVGYRLLSNYLEQRADLRLEVSFDNNNYNEKDLVEIRIPLQLPYQTNWTDFQRYDGEVEINGIHYKYVKRKISEGQLVLLCLPNHTKTHLENSKADFFKLVNDLQHPGHEKGNTNTSFKSFVTEYWEQKNEWTIASLSPMSDHHTGSSFCFYQSLHVTAPSQPPDMLVA